jgi:8-oxo-dGTP diphosphatase
VRFRQEIQALPRAAQLSAPIPRIHVVAAVLENSAGRILIAQRPPGKSLAGAWEFPGGKLHSGEARLAGLARELDEELGIRVESARPLIRYLHRYQGLEVDLDAWRVTRWQGAPHGREGQALAWHAPGELLQVGLLPADAVIVNAVRLPPMVMVTPPAAPDGEGDFLDALEAAAGRGGQWICLRRPDLDAAALLELAAGAACRIEGSGARLLLHGEPRALAPLLLEPPPALRARLGDAAAGLHVPARCLAGLAGRPVPDEMWFGASCHDAGELDAAEAAGADYAFLGNVLATPSHPGAEGLGWDAFAGLVRERPMPVYGIGGLGPADLEAAWAAGAQGIAAIRGLWGAG